MTPLTKIKVPKAQFDFLVETLPKVEIELEWGYDGEGNNVGKYSSNDFVVEYEEFDIMIQLSVVRTGTLTLATHLYPSEFKEVSLAIEVGKIKLISDDCCDVVLNNQQYENLKNKIISSIQII